MLSKKFSNAQTRYTTIEKEMFSIYYSVKYWHCLIKASEIEIHTNNRNILHNTKDFNKKTERWKAFLSGYNVSYVFIKGKENLIADELSRNLNNVEKINDNFRTNIKDLHCNNGHPGSKVMINTLRLEGKLSKLEENIIKEICKCCVSCQKCKTGNTKYGILKGTISSELPFHDISSDIFGPFPPELYDTKIKEKMYIITFTDRCTRFTKVKFIKDIEPKTILKALISEWINIIGKPKSFLTDNGKSYNNKFIRNELSKLGIRHKLTSPYNPTGNAISERVNSHLVTVLRIYKGYKISELKTIIENKINKFIYSITKRTPQSLLDEYLSGEKYKQFKVTDPKSSEGINKHRTKYDYKQGDDILIRKFVRHKLDDLFEGPFKIKAIRGEQLTLESKNKRSKHLLVNLKNVKPFFVQERCRC